MNRPEKNCAAPVNLTVAKSYTPHTQQDSGFPPLSRQSSMQCETGFSERLAALYPSTAKDAKWAQAVDQLRRLTSLSTAVLDRFNARLCQEEITVRGRVAFTDAGRAVSDGRYAVDPVPIICKSLMGITPGREVVPAELHKTELHNDVLAPQDLHPLAILPFVNTQEHFEQPGASREETVREFDAEALHLFECALPYLHAGQVLRRELDDANLRAARAEAALEHTVAAAFLLDAGGRVVHMNRSGEAMIRSSGCLMLRRNRIIAANVSQQSRLKALIGRAISAAQASATPSGEAMALERDSGRRPLFVRVLPLCVESTNERAPSGHALLLITDPDGVVKDPSHLLKSLFSLTTAEIAVAASLRAGFTLAEIAAVRGVSRETIRSQLKSLLQKTNTRRQSDLVHLLTTLIT